MIHTIIYYRMSQDCPREGFSWFLGSALDVLDVRFKGILDHLEKNSTSEIITSIVYLSNSRVHI